MTDFSLTIVTPDGIKFQGQAQEVIVRTTSGDLGVLAGHTNCVAPLGMGRTALVVDGKKRYAACIGGMLSVVDGKVTMVCTTFEWSDEIDLERVSRSEKRARSVLADKTSTQADIRLAEARLKRALIRKNIGAIK